MGRPPRRAGMVLILVSALLAFLTLLGFALGHEARAASLRGEIRIGERMAQLAAESGVAYASARLSENPFPAKNADPLCRGDDWTCRDGTTIPLEKGLNPSYSHGEPWTDDGDGRFSPDPDWTDHDGDCRFSATSGRLRGGTAGDSTHFLLQVTSPNGGIPVNGGSLLAEDRYGSGITPNGRPDHRDPEIPCHRGLVHALNNLGVICDLRTSRWTVGPLLDPGHPENAIEASWLGYDLIENRPPGGYRSIADARATLSSLGYAPDEIEAVTPHLDTGPYTASLPGSARFLGMWDGPDSPAHTPVNLLTASPEILQALWVYLAAAFTPHWSEEPEWRKVPSSRTGGLLRFGDRDPTIIFPDEARRLADHLIALRQADPGALTWKRFLEDLVSNAADLFPIDLIDTASCPYYQRERLQAKVDIAFQAVTEDPYPYVREEDSLATWSGWGIDRVPGTGHPSSAGCQQWISIPLCGIRQILYPSSPLGSWQYMEDPYYKMNDRPFLPLGGHLAPPARWRVESLGRLGRTGQDAKIDVTIQTGKTLILTSQEDFEHGGTHPARLAAAGLSIAPEDEPIRAKRHDVTEEIIPAVHGAPSTTRRYPHVTTLPRWNRFGIARAADVNASPYYGFSRRYGCVTLASRQCGRLGADLYWGFKEDFDERPDNDAGAGPVWTEDEHGDFWHEQAPGLASPPIKPYPGGAIHPLFTSVDDYHANPHHGSGDFLDMPEFPGLSASGTGAIECWISGAGSLVICMGNHRLNLAVQRVPLDFSGDPLPGLLASLDVTFGNAPQKNLKWFIPDIARISPPPALTHHLFLVIRRAGPQTVFALFVDGVQQTDTLTADGNFMGGAPGLLLVSGCDELRLYSTVPPDAAFATERFRLGRFARKGTFRSPLYACDRPATLSRLLWNGFTPPGYANTDGTPLLAVTLQAYADAAGDVPLAPAPLPEGTASDLTRLGPVGSFRYIVDFNGETVPFPLLDTPVFESIDLTLSRTTRCLEWAGSGSR